jgi:hypothetical protein
MDPLSFASLDAAKKKRTKRGVFLAEMAAVVPCVALEALIEPHYPKAGPSGGRRPFPLLRLLQKKRRSEVLRNSEIGGFRERVVYRTRSICPAWKAILASLPVTHQLWCLVRGS